MRNIKPRTNLQNMLFPRFCTPQNKAIKFSALRFWLPTYEQCQIIIMGRFSGLWRVKGYLHVLKTTTTITISWVVLRDESRLFVFVLVMLAVTAAGCVDAAYSVAWNIQTPMRFCPACLLKYLLSAYPLKHRAPVCHVACVGSRQTVHIYGNTQVGARNPSKISCYRSW
jgi:hypothetical protein